MEGKPYRGSRGGAKARKKRFYETQDFLRKLLKKLAARWGEDYHLPRIEYDAADPAIASIEDIDWALVTSLDTLVVHALACTVPSLRSLLDKLNLSVDRKPQLAPGDGPPSPRPWQVAGASGGPPNPRGPNVPTHQDWDAVRDDPELSARLALYDPEEDAQPPSAGAAASTDPVVIVHAEGAADGAPDLDLEPAAAPEPAEPFLVPEADLVVQEADDLPLGTRRLFNTVLLSTKGRKSRRRSAVQLAKARVQPRAHRARRFKSSFSEVVKQQISLPRKRNSWTITRWQTLSQTVSRPVLRTLYRREQPLYRTHRLSAPGLGIALGHGPESVHLLHPLSQ